MLKKRGNILALASLIIILIILSGCTHQEQIPQKISKSVVKNIFDYSFNVSQSEFNQTYLEHDDGQEIITLKLIQNINSEVANSMISDRTALFESIFEPKRVDYPGQYTHTIICPDKFKPKYSEINNTDEQINYFIGYANSNKVAGACSADLIKYNFAYGFLNCPKNNMLVEINYYSILQLNKTQQFIKSINCAEIYNNFIEK